MRLHGGHPRHSRAGARVTAATGEATVGSYDVACPVCDDTIPIPVKCVMLDADKAFTGEARLSCEPDMTDLWAHMWTHDPTTNG